VALVRVTRGRHVLYGWLGLALIAFLAFNALAGAGGGRYTMGWVLSRISGVVSASVLLVFFLGQFTRLHRAVVQGLQQVRDANAQLEQRVAARTAALTQANRALQHEVAARRQAEVARQRDADRLALLHTIDQALLAEPCPETMLAGAVGPLHALCACWQVQIALFDWSADEGWGLTWADSGPLYGPSGMRWSLEAFGRQDLQRLHAGQVCGVEEVRGGAPLPALLQPVQAAGLRAYLRVPLRAQGDLLGALTLLADRPGAFPSDAVAIAREVADQLAVALRHAQWYAQVQRHAAELEARVRARTAELEAANHELEAFSYSVSHDLRAPLRAIQGFARILLDTYAPSLPDQAQHYLHLVVDSAQHMGQLIEDLLAFSRMSRQPLTKQPVALAALVRQVLQDLRPLQGARHIDVCMGTLPLCQADPALLKQVMSNLLANALKFTSRRAAAVIEVGWRQEQGEAIYFVKDNGAGFDMAYADKLFGVFQRLHRADEYEGTGVGLAIVQRIIHRHGGRIWAEAAVEQGATFSFTLGGAPAPP